MIGLAVAALLTSCEKTSEPKQVEKPAPRAIAAVDLTSPAPDPVHIVEAEKETPEPPPKISGPARPADQEEESDQTPVPTPQAQPESDYPKAKPTRKRAQFAAVQVSGYPTTRTSHRIQNQHGLPNYRRHGVGQASAYRPPTIPNRRQPVLPQRRSSYRPPTVAVHQPRSVPQAPSYPRSNGAHQQQMAWQNEHRRLKNEYMQSRADALNIKYNRGRPHFSANSPQVMLSASAPPSTYFQTRPRAPWDRLGQAFDRSEQARQRLRQHEQSRYRPQIPRAHSPRVPNYRPSPQSYRPGPSIPRPNRAQSYRPVPYTPPIPGCR